MAGKGDIRLTQTTLRILQTFITDVSKELSGADVWKETKIGAGSRYPILIRLERAGWLTSRWEELNPSEAGRPRKRFYRLTVNGQAWAQSALKERDMWQGAPAWNI
jgi:PadR family transcriptional regulator, regulatory protein PadR